MTTYKVKDKVTGKEITFKWNSPTPPTEKDIEEIFEAAGVGRLIEKGLPVQTPESGKRMMETELRKEPSWYEIAARQIPRVGGGILGGMAATPLGPAGILGGVAAGATVGEALEQLRRSIFEPRIAPRTPTEAVTRPFKAGVEEAIGQAAGGIIAKGFGKALAPFAKKVTPEAERAINTLKNDIQPALLPSEATESRILDVMENIAEGSILGGGSISAYKIKRQKVLNKIADDIVDMFGGRANPDDVGELFLAAVERNWDKFKKVVTDPIYNKVETMAEGAIIKTDSLKKFAEPLKTISKNLKSIEAKNAGDDLVNSILKLPKEIDFATAKELRGRLLSRVDEFSVINKKAPAIGKANRFIALIDKEIENGLKSHNPEAYNLWREANRLYKEGSEQFNNRLIRALVKKGDPDFGGSPELIADAIFRPGRITTIEKVKNAVDRPTWEQLQSYYVQKLLHNSTDPVTGYFSGSKMINMLYGKGGMGEQTLKKIFNPSQLKAIDDFANAAKFAEGIEKEGTAKVFIKLAQASAFTKLLVSTMGIGRSAEVDAAAGAIILTPPILSKMLLNPTTAKYLTLGFKVSPKTPEMFGIATRILAAAERAREDYVEYFKEKEEPVTKEEREILGEFGIGKRGSMTMPMP